MSSDCAEPNKNSEPATISRREMLALAGVAFTAATFPSAVLASTPSRLQSSSHTQNNSVMQTLSDYMSAAAQRALPEEVTEKTKHHLLDTLAAIISGSNLLPGQKAVEFARAYGGREIATVVASKIVCGPIEAALANGVLAHADETDDSHAPSQSHPGCAVIPAALATGENFHITGARLLRAVALGYDIGTRVTVTLGGQQFESESHWSTHSISPLFGAAAAAGCAASLNAQQMRWLLGYTAQQSSGLGAWNRDTEHIQKAFLFGGMTARSGVTSGLLVQAGWTGVDDIFSGKDNFFVAYNPKADPNRLIEKLGERYEVTRTNIKKWPVGSPIQAALDALEIIRMQHPFQANDVRQLTVRLATDEAAIVNNREIPDICVQHILAVALLDDTVSFASAHDRERMKDPSLLAQRAKINLQPDAELERLMPLRVAVVEITLANGEQLSHRVDNVRGTPENPMSRAEIATKARDLITPVLGKEKSKLLLEKIFAVETVRDICELRPLLQL